MGCEYNTTNKVTKQTQVICIQFVYFPFFFSHLQKYPKKNCQKYSISNERNKTVFENSKTAQTFLIRKCHKSHTQTHQKKIFYITDFPRSISII